MGNEIWYRAATLRICKGVIETGAGDPMERRLADEVVALHDDIAIVQAARRIADQEAKEGRAEVVSLRERIEVYLDELMAVRLILDIWIADEWWRLFTLHRRLRTLSGRLGKFLAREAAGGYVGRMVARLRREEMLS